MPGQVPVLRRKPGTLTDNSCPFATRPLHSTLHAFIHLRRRPAHPCFACQAGRLSLCQGTKTSTCLNATACPPNSAPTNGQIRHCNAAEHFSSGSSSFQFTGSPDLAQARNQKSVTLPSGSGNFCLSWRAGRPSGKDTALHGRSRAAMKRWPSDTLRSDPMDAARLRPSILRSQQSQLQASPSTVIRSLRHWCWVPSLETRRRQIMPNLQLIAVSACVPSLCLAFCCPTTHTQPPPRSARPLIDAPASRTTTLVLASKISITSMQRHHVQRAHESLAIRLTLRHDCSAMAASA